MTSPRSPSPVLRASGGTLTVFRAIKADMTAALAGTGHAVTDARMVAAMVAVVRNHREELLVTLQMTPEQLDTYLATGQEPPPWDTTPR